MLRKKMILVILFVVIPMVFFGCSSSAPEPETITLDAVFESTKMALDAEFASISGMIYQDRLYVCGQVDGMVTIASVDGENITYQKTDIAAPAMGFTKNGDSYMVVTGRQDAFSKESIYTLSTVSGQGNIIAAYDIPIVLQEEGTLHLFPNRETMCLADSEKCISVKADGTYEVLFYFEDYGAFTAFSDTGKDILFTFRNPYGEIECYTFEEPGILVLFTDVAPTLSQTATAIFFAKDTYYVINTQGIYDAADPTQMVLSWSNSCIDFSYVSDTVFVDANHLYILYRSSTTEPIGVYSLKASADTSSKERLVIRVSYYESGSKMVPRAARMFNALSDKYYVICEEGATVFTESSEQGAAELSAFDKAILSDKIGDVIVLNTDFRKYADSGIFSDLTPYMVEGQGIQREQIFSCVLDSLTYKDKLYAITPYFRIETLAGKRANLPFSTWTCSDFIHASHSLESPRQILAVMSQSNLKNILLDHSVNSFINLEAATCDFTSTSFRDILAYLDSLPTEVPLLNGLANVTPYQEDTYLLYPSTIGCIADYLSLKVRFGNSEDVELIGFPSAKGGQSFIKHSDYYAISEKSLVKDGAWEFIQFLLQNCLSLNTSIANSYIPVLDTTVFQEWCAKQQRYQYLFTDGAAYTPIDVQEKSEAFSYTITQDIIEEFVAMMDSTSSISPLPAAISDIIHEETERFFAGTTTVEQAAQMIQSRCELYLAETKR